MQIIFRTAVRIIHPPMLSYIAIFFAFFPGFIKKVKVVELNIFFGSQLEEIFVKLALIFRGRDTQMLTFSMGRPTSFPDHHLFPGILLLKVLIDADHIFSRIIEGCPSPPGIPKRIDMEHYII